MILKIKDETASGKLINELNIFINSEIITVRELITHRVKLEVENYNSTKEEYFNGLIQPTDSEKTLNGYKMKIKKDILPEIQIDKALNAFEENGFFIIANDRQLESLEESIFIDRDSHIAFIKLVPLVGG